MLLHTETFKRLVWAVSKIDNARKKYVNIERLSSGDIFALLDSIESDNEGDINKISFLEDYWSTDKCIRNEKIQNVMTRTRFQSILKNLHFSNNEYDDKTDKSYKIRPAIEHLNKVFAESLSNSLFQSVDKHMYKFKGRSSMEQYIKNNLIKWEFKYWFRCDSETGHIYQLELCQGRKEKSGLNLGSSVVLDLCQVLKYIYCHVFFDNFFQQSHPDSRVGW